MHKNRATGQKKKEVKGIEIETAIASNYNKFDFKFRKREFKFTDKQKHLIDMMNDPKNKIVIIEGPAGTSKTLLAVYCGLTLLKEAKMDKLLYIRSVVESAHKSLGYLKGDLEDKLKVWRQPLDDKLEELVEPSNLSTLSGSGKLEVIPINYLRGASWRDTFVICDEFQNTTMGEGKTILTRVGEGSKLILCGDSEQSDIRDSGFNKIFKMFNNDLAREQGVVTFKFTENDIVRSEIVKFIVQTFSEFEKNGHTHLIV